MKLLATLPFLALLAVSSSAFASSVTTDRGAIEGTSADGIISYKGIPYAAPPVGELRWRPPQPALAWTGVRQADRHSPACPQQGTYPLDAPAEATSEDCLTLNVWTPANIQGEKLAVMVWIHGGGLINGSGSIPLYSGDRLAKRGVIVVTLNYRLGALGFLAHPELDEESAYGGSGNYGLLDQIAALEWVQRNIAAFGGDPQRVTVFGQSSGAFSISALVASPKAGGLFQRAIAQSGGIFEPVELDPQFTPTGAAQAGIDFARRAGAANLAELRRLPPEALVAVRFRPQFNLDGHVLTATPRAAYAAAAEHQVDLLLGSNAEEGAYFHDPEQLNLANHRAMLARTFPAPLIDAVGLEPARTDAEARDAAITLDTDLRFRWDMWSWASRAAQRGSRKVFLYEFARIPPFAPGEIYYGKGAAHGVELAFAFDQLDRFQTNWTRYDHLLAETTATYWTNFAKTGDPNGAGLPVWPGFASENGPVMQLDAAPSVQPVRNLPRLLRIEQIYTAFVAGAAGARN